MFLKVLYALLIAAECVLVPLFLKYSWPEKCVKSLVFKMISSTVFILCAVIARAVSGHNDPYSTLIIWGLVFGWLGDLFLHIPKAKIYISGLGLFAFLAGHIFYIAAFQKAIVQTYPDASFFAWYEIVGVAAFVAIVALYALLKKIKAKIFMVIPVVLYAVTISYMLAKAVRYCVGELAYGTNDHIVFIFFTVVLGAVLFVLSDASLGLILFAGQEKNRPLKFFNIGTYYVAQLLLGASILFIKVRVLSGI